MKSKNIILAASATILVMIVSIAAIAAFPKKVNIQSAPTPNAADIEKQQKSVQTTRGAYEEMARYYGIDPTGMTDEQLEAALLQYMPEQDQLKLKQSIATKTDLEVQKENQQLTPEQRHYILLNNARACGIDPTGMTDEQIEQAIAEKDKEASQGVQK